MCRAFQSCGKACACDTGCRVLLKVESSQWMISERLPVEEKSRRQEWRRERTKRAVREVRMADGG